MQDRSTTTPTDGGAGPPVLRLLGPIGLTGTRPLTSQQLSLVTYLSCLGPTRPEVLADALWDGAPISDRRLVNLVSSVRSALGRHHLPDGRGDGYRLVGVPSDLDLLVQITPPPGTTTEDGDHEVLALEAALRLVRGPVMARPGRRHWRWLDDHPEVVARAEAIVGERTGHLIELLRHRHRPDRARAVCERMLRFQPLDGGLILALEALHREQGRPVAAHRLVAGWRRRVIGLTGEDPLPDDGQASTGSAVTTTLPW